MADLLPSLLLRISAAIANTVGSWLAAGFVHGVLNTDNFNVTGESFDYGPWRFLPHFDPNLTAAYFDQTGRYAYGRQSDAALWAVCRLADCFIKIVPQKDLENQLRSFHSLVEAQLAKQIQWRLGIFFDNDDAIRDAALTRDFFGAAKASQYGFDQIFHDLYGGQPRIEGYDANHWKPVLNHLQDASPRNIAALDHPHFQAQKALSMTIDEVEAIWDPIAANDDWSLLSAKLAAIHQMRQAYGVGDVPLPRIVGGPAFNVRRGSHHDSLPREVQNCFPYGEHGVELTGRWNGPCQNHLHLGQRHGEYSRFHQQSGNRLIPGEFWQQPAQTQPSSRPIGHAA